MSKKTTGLPTGRKAHAPGALDLGALETGEVEVPPAPATLDTAGRQYWLLLWTTVTTLTTTDALIVTQLCEALQEKRYLSELIASGTVSRFQKINGNTITAHPVVGMVKSQNIVINGLLSELGLSPSARAKIGSLEDGLESLLKMATEARKERQKARSVGSGGVV